MDGFPQATVAWGRRVLGYEKRGFNFSNIVFTSMMCMVSTANFNQFCRMFSRKIKRMFILFATLGPVGKTCWLGPEWALVW